MRANVLSLNMDEEWPGRSSITRYLQQRIDDTRRKASVLALLFLELKEFSNLRNTFGRTFSDALHIEAAARLHAVLGRAAYLAPLGEGAFACLLHDVYDRADVQAIADEIAETLGAVFVSAGGLRRSAGVSIGIAMYPCDARDGEALLQCADMAMHAAKAGGRHDHLFYERRMSSAMRERFMMEEALRDGLARREFVVYYQPRVDCRTGQLRAIEALARWNHAERGLLEPGEFIGVAEACGLIVPLGEQMIEMVCHQLAEWKRLGLPLVAVSINVSPRQLNGCDLTAAILRHTRAHGVDPALLEIEVTESCLIEYDQEVKHRLASLAGLGLKLLLDDFGTGYSSLSHVQEFDMDVLKVDRSFTARLRAGRDGQALVSAIVAMAHALDMEVVAEGVETREQLRLLQALRCDEVQGYLVSKPVPAAAMAALMGKRSLFDDDMLAARSSPVASGASRHRNQNAMFVESLT